MADFPRIKWINVDGQQRAFSEPQHFTGNGDETVRTGESNPLPTKDAAVESRLESIEQAQSQILAKLNDTIDTRLTGSNVEEEYNGEMVVKTRTMGLSWESFNPFDSQTITVPGGSYVDRSSDSMVVNGYSSLGLIARDSNVANRGKFYISVYWTGREGILQTPPSSSRKIQL